MRNPMFLLGILYWCCACAENETRIYITNPSEQSLFEKPVTIVRAHLRVKDQYPVIEDESGKPVPCQLIDTDDNGCWDEVFFVLDIKPNGRRTLVLSWEDEPLDYPVRTSIRFGKRDDESSPVYPVKIDTFAADKLLGNLGYMVYQTEGPTIENDKVGFRYYFDGRNAMDLFGKKIPEISPESVGIGRNGGVFDNYHVMSDWGRDILSVGNSAGLGGIELMVDDSIVRLGAISGDTSTNIERSVVKILNEGPVFSSLQLNHQNWVPLEDRNYQVTEDIKIWPGFYGYQKKVYVQGTMGDETLLVGLVNRNTPEELLEVDLDDWVILYTHDQQTYGRFWWLGMALILPRSHYLGYGEAPEEGTFSNSFYGKLNLNSQPVTYYAIGCWELSPDKGFNDELFFKDYLINLAQQISIDLEVEIL